MARVIKLKGDPEISEEGNATEVITPGYLIAGQTSIAKSTVDGLVAPIRIAMERDELGRGIDANVGASLDTNEQAGETADYASGENVKVGHFKSGERFLGFIASGVGIVADNFLEASGSGGTPGTFEGLSGIHPLVRALETVTATDPGDTRIRLEVI